MHRRLLTTIALAGLAGLAVPTGAAAADPPVTWQVQPVAVDGAPRSAVDVALDPGGTVSDAVAVTNLGGGPLTLRVLAVDAMTTASGGLTTVPDGAPSYAGSWVTPATEAVTVGPGERVEVPFTVAPPDDAEPGDYAVAVVAALTRPATVEGGQEVVLDARVGARVYLRVLGQLHAQLRVADLTVTRDAPWWNPLPAPARTDFVLENVGNVRLDGTAQVRLRGPFGWLLGTSEVRTLPQLLPGDRVRASALAPDGAEPAGPVVVDGILAPFVLSAEVTLSATEVSTGQPFTYSSTVSTVDIPWVALVVLLLVVTALLLARRRRSARRRPAPVPQEEPVRV